MPGPLLHRAVDGLAGYEVTLYEGEGHTVAQTHAPEILAGLAELG